jgi:PAS domain S-box-containing protein
MFQREKLKGEPGTSSSGGTAFGNNVFRYLRFIVLISAFASILTGLIVITGWTFEISVLKSFFSSYIPMKANTAICFTLLGSALLLLYYSSKNSFTGKIAGFLAGMVIMISLISLLEYLLNWNAGIDELLFKDSIADRITLFPGRLAFNTAICFLLLGLSVLFIDSEQKLLNYLAQIFPLMTWLLTIMSFLGYLYGKTDYLTLAYYNNMALNTAVTFLFISLGIFCLRPASGFLSILTVEGPGGYIARRLLPLTILIPVLFIWIRLMTSSEKSAEGSVDLMIVSIFYIGTFAFFIWKVAKSVNSIDSDRIHAEHQLAESEERFSLAFRLSPAAQAISLYKDGKIIDANEAFCRLVGYSHAELIGQSTLGLNIWDDPSERVKMQAELTSNGKVQNFEIRIRNSSGKIHTILGSFEYIKLQNETSILSSAIDITDWKKAREKVIVTEERYRSALDNMLEGCQIIGFDWRYIYINHAAGIHNRKDIESMIAKKYSDVWPGIEKTHIYSIIGDCLENRNSHHLENEFVYPDGVVSLFDLSIQPVPEGAFILSIDISERKLAEKSLLESEQKYRYLFENNPLPMWIYDLQTLDFLEVNDAAIEHYGYSKEEFLSMTLKDIRPEEDVDSLLADVKNTYHIYNKAGIWRHRKKNGEIIYVEIISHKVEFESNSARLVLVNDVTERNLYEDALRKSEEQFRMLFEQAYDGIFLTDPEAKYTEANPVGCELLGYPPEEIKMLKLEDLLTEDDKNKIGPAIDTLVRDGILRISCSIRRKDNTVFLGEIVSKKLPDGRIQTFLRDITESRRAEREIQHLNKRITAATGASHVGIWDWNVVDNQLLWDDQMYMLYGLEKERFSPAYESWVNGLHPEDKARCMQESELALSGEKVYDTEFRVIWPDNSVHHLRSKGEVIRDDNGKPLRMLGVNFDITALKQTEEALNNSEAKYRIIAENSDDWIYWLSPDGTTLRFISPSCEKMTGYSAEEFQNNYALIKRIVHPDDLEIMESHEQGIRDQKSTGSFDFRIIKKSGDVCWINHSCSPIYEKNGKYAGRRATNRNINSRKLAEEEILKLNQTLENRVQQRTAQLEASNRELEAFSYSVSHDLRSPLRHINGFSEVLSKQYSDQLPAEAKNHLNTIMVAARKMGIMIDDLLNFSRTGRAEIKKSTIEMNQVVDDAMLQIKPSLTGRNIIWNISHLPKVHGDYSLLRMAWVNLLDNAVKYTCTREKAEITIGYKKGKKESVFHIKDNGVGFDMKYTHKLFGVFQRLHSSSQFEGTGIGLANVQRIIIRHGGRIWAEAELDKGAVFYFSIPNEMEDKS